jgi:hypothetical protein
MRLYFSVHVAHIHRTETISAPVLWYQVLLSFIYTACQSTGQFPLRNGKIDFERSGLCAVKKVEPAVLGMSPPDAGLTALTSSRMTQ